MVFISKEFYEDWFSDNVFDLRIDFCNNIERTEYLNFISDNNLINDAYGRREFTEGYDNFLAYCQEQFKLWCEEHNYA